MHKYVIYAFMEVNEYRCKYQITFTIGYKLTTVDIYFGYG